MLSTHLQPRFTLQEALLTLCWRRRGWTGWRTEWTLVPGCPWTGIQHGSPGDRNRKQCSDDITEHPIAFCQEVRAAPSEETAKEAFILIGFIVDQGC